MNINVKNLNSSEAVIEIEGVIGLNEDMQFADNETPQRVSTYEKFRNELEKIDTQNVNNLRINIRSMGGSVHDALLIHSAICSLPSNIRVQTYCYGFSASAATIIAQAASEGERYIASSALYMIHKTSTQFDGNATEATTVAEMLEKTDLNIAEIYASRSGLSTEHFLEIMEREGGQGEWLTAEETVEAGLADKVENFASLKHIMNYIKNFFGQLISPKDNAQRNPSHEGNHSKSPKANPSTETPSTENPLPEELNPEGVSPEGISPEGISPEGISPEGISPEGISPEGISPEGISPEGISPEEAQPKETPLTDSTPTDSTPNSHTPEQSGEKRDSQRGDRERGDRERGDSQRGDRERGDREKNDNKKEGKENKPSLTNIPEIQTPKNITQKIEVQSYTATAEKTQTEMKEDPEIEHYSVTLNNSNNKAYTKDIELFRGR
ncbi:MAG: ATP-dependent Clp protease proteolytic subunit [Rikenellaceae bacterium]